MTEQYETDTHEMRQLKDFQIGDEIVVLGTAYNVLMIAHRSPRMNIMYGNTDGILHQLREYETKEFIARKREPDGLSI